MSSSAQTGATAFEVAARLWGGVCLDPTSWRLTNGPMLPRRLQQRFPVQISAKVPGRILVIDDEKSARLLLERVLTRAGHQVVLAETGEQGISQLGRDNFDLVITDKNLPGISGLEVLKAARVQNPALQAI